MKNILITLVVLFTIISCTEQKSVTNPEVTADEIYSHIEFLASDSLTGRKPGTDGSLIAANYIRDNFTKYGLELLGDNGFQYFELVTKSEAGNNNSLRFANFEAELNTDFGPFSFSENDTVDAEAVFVGYGLIINEDSLKWDDYKDIDVKGKWVIVLRGDPELSNTESRFIPYSGDRSKVLTAKDNGAVGVIFIAGVSFNDKDKLAGLFYDKTTSRSGLPVVNVTRNLLNIYFQTAGVSKTIEELETELNESHLPKPINIPLNIQISTDVILQKTRTQNIIAVLESNKNNT